MGYKDFLKENGEKKWQEYWEEKKLHRAEDNSSKSKFYALVEFPYPSAEGLHVGHPRSYTALDIIARKRRMEGFNVLYPIGWDAFGLPTENYAIKTGVHPRIVTEKNISNFKRQLKAIGFSFDWSREINTTDPKYYKWTQWIFLQLFKHGLAYKTEMAINFCTSCKVGLANEEVVNGKCERCGSEVIKKTKKQWMLRITKYADRLEKDLEEVNYLDKIKTQQKNWIGRSEGAEVYFKIKNSEFIIEVYTTRPDTLFGATYMVLAPEHKLIEQLKDEIENWDEVNTYIVQAQNKSDLERTELAKEKTGVELKGIKAINPVNGIEIPVWISDYVLASYGTGAIMAVPAHDERDWEFAKKFGLEIVQVVAPLFGATLEKDKVQPDKETIYRKNVCAIVKHWKEDSYYCLNWEKYNWKSFVMGGVEDDETLERAAIREMTEETGYKNIKSVRQLGGETHNYYFAEHKGFNRYAYSFCVLIELSDGERNEKEIDEVHHRGEWVNNEDVSSYINLTNHEVYWDVYKNGEKAFTDIEKGIMINSDFLNGLKPSEAIGKMTAWLEEKGYGKKAVNYKLRDWVFSRQRYWGEPIPIIECEKCGFVPLEEKDLPLELPEIKEFQASEDGQSPLAKLDSWVNIKCPKCGGLAKRETDTMPQWAGSSWYFLRYIDPSNNKELADRKKLDYWTPVNWYNGGMEHTTLHLLYSRFWHKFLFDIGIVPTSEPYAKRTSQGMILGESGEKMSKSRGNVVNPDEVVKEYGADTLRIYEMFMGPFDQTIPWDTKGVVGVKRFLEKIWNIFEFVNDKDDAGLIVLLNKTIKKVGEDIEAMRFNTAISAMMILINKTIELKSISKNSFENLLKILSPFAPHMAEELWNKLGNKESIFKEAWPTFDESKIKDEQVEVVVQINGKVRAKLNLIAGISEAEAIQLAKENENVAKYLENANIKKTIFVPNKLISFVI